MGSEVDQEAEKRIRIIIGELTIQNAVLQAQVDHLSKENTRLAENQPKSGQADK